MDLMKEIGKLDPSNMMGNVLKFPYMVKESIRIGKDAELPKHLKGLPKILITGLGGSAIGGDILRNILYGSCPAPIVVNRNYLVPDWVDKDTMVIAVSHSGNTEETVSAFKDALNKKAKLLVVTTGGILDLLAKENNIPTINIHAGAPPRASLPYLFFPILIALEKLGYTKIKGNEFHDLITLLEKLKAIYDPNVRIDDNPAKQIAGKLFAKPVIVFGTADTTDAVATRWKCQLAENSKVFSFTSTMPEMNHNEIVGWELLKKVLRKFAVVFLQDRFDPVQIKKRIALTKAVIEKKANWVGEVNSIGETGLERIFSLIYLGDFVSVYLAFLYKEDPTAIKMIDELKKELMKK